MNGIKLIITILNLEEYGLLFAIVKLGNRILLNILGNINDFFKMILDLLDSGKFDLTLINI